MITIKRITDREKEKEEKEEKDEEEEEEEEEQKRTQKMEKRRNPVGLIQPFFHSHPLSLSFLTPSTERITKNDGVEFIK